MSDSKSARLEEYARTILALEAKVARYEAPGGWAELMARDARRVLGDPIQGVSGRFLAPTPHSLSGRAIGRASVEAQDEQKQENG